MELVEKKKRKKPEKHMAIKYDVALGCPMCGEQNEVEYVMGLKERFDCKKCGQPNNVVMTFLAIVDNPPGTRTMMVKPQEKRGLNTNVGGVIERNGTTNNG
jgi:transcription elongation factor Elf1